MTRNADTPEDRPIPDRYSLVLRFADDFAADRRARASVRFCRTWARASLGGDGSKEPAQRRRAAAYYRRG